ncbi:hypothetical protein [Streptomyces cadmiisoli]|uniref:hypothetical protein n=1 Tax=Streptomyces cadmiisoli TaxID=2184053 RepID=UPI003D732151
MKSRCGGPSGRPCHADGSANFGLLADTRTTTNGPEVEQALAGADLVSQPRAAAVRNARRQAHGPGWVLAGDAGHYKDPVSAQGISDAFADASTGLDSALAGYAATRDAQRLGAFAYTCEQAELRHFGAGVLGDLAGTAADERAVEAFLNTFVGCDAPSDPGWLGESHY